MTDIELVIKISEDSYKATCSGSMLPPDVKNVVNAIKNGTPLPKGHGDLIDRNELLSHTKCTYRYDCPGSSCDKCSDNCVEVRDIENAKPVIQADNEGET